MEERRRRGYGYAQGAEGRGMSGRCFAGDSAEETSGMQCSKGGLLVG